MYSHRRGPSEAEAKIIRRAGLKPWPKLFQNLRSTRETELADQFPIQVVCDWIGNTEAIAAKHYLQVTEDHFARAVGQGAPKGGQKEGQHPAVLARRGSQADLPAHEKPLFCRGLRPGARWCNPVEWRIGDSNPGRFPAGIRVVAGQGGAESGANETGLVSVIDA